MNVNGNNTILITGGSGGIGFALAERLVKAGNTVIVCGRREDKLREAAGKVPGLHTIVCDVATGAQREQLAKEVLSRFPSLNVLINNAGVMRFTDLKEAPNWEEWRQEIAINLEAPIHLSSLLFGHLNGQANPAIFTVSSGLAFVPLVAAPIYSATKAAIHAYTLSLRQQLAGTQVEVVEICPPHVNTDLGAPGANEAGMPLDEFIDAVMAGLASGAPEISTGFSAMTSQASRAQLDEAFRRLNQIP